MCRPMISVIVPCYNMEQYLSECLDSILSQTLDNFEVICIDDGSNDQTPAILDAIQLADPRVRVVHQQNQGVAAARNLGILLATGTFVAFMDPDDFYPNSNILELLYRKAIEQDVLICGGSFSNYNNLTKKISTCYTADYSGYMLPKEGYLSYKDYQFDFGYHRFIYKRDFLTDNGIFFPPYARFQDPPFFVKAMITAGGFYAVPDVAYRYRVGIQDKPTSWPSAKLHDMIQGHIDILKLSSEEHLSQLHALTIRRFEDDMVFEPVMKSLRENNEVTKALLYKFNSSINPALLAQSKSVAAKDDAYIIRELRELNGINSEKKASFLQFTVKKIRTIHQFYRKNGIRCTLRLFYEILNN